MRCHHRSHPWDRFHVGTAWMPRPLRCLIVGEHPGSARTPYFYDGAHGVAVRTILLAGLHGAGLLASPTLEAFRAAGFVLDHGIRCPLDDLEEERRLAARYASPRANAAAHLAPLVRRAPAVWVMGYVARNAVAAACPAFPRDRGNIARPPYPAQLQAAPRFFVSRYLTRTPDAEVRAIFAEFAAFWARRRALAADRAPG